jgi:hypothetical protein
MLKKKGFIENVVQDTIRGVSHSDSKSLLNTRFCEDKHSWISLMG